MEYGLIGEKLGHSFSKEIHEKLADYQYNITPLTREEFPEFMKARDFKAINVTIPYKCDVIPYLDEMDSNSKSIGAVNTIVNKEGKLIGHNTDFSGFLYMVEHHNVTIEGKKILVIGNGGASKAVIAVLNHLQAKEIIIIDIVSGPSVITKEEAVKNHTDVDVIINTSPVGMYPNVDQSPIDLTLFPHCKAVLDIIYNPLQTKLTKQASELGMQAINGLEMLVGQAKYAVEFFLDKSIDDDVIDPIYHQIMTDMMKV